MDIDRQVLFQLGVGGGTTILFVAAVVFVGMQSGTRGLTEQGALTLVGVIVAFVVVLAALGLATSEQLGAGAGGEADADADADAEAG